MQRGRLLSLPFLSLYLAAVGAVLLNAERGRWGSAPWFPMALGLTAALAVAPLVFLLKRSSLDRSTNDWLRIVLFSVSALLPLVGLPFLGRGNVLLICGLLVMSALFGYAAIGTLCHWPGLRPPRKSNECRKCGYDLTGNTSGTCPECGTPKSNQCEKCRYNLTGNTSGRCPECGTPIHRHLVPNQKSGLPN